MQTTSCLAPRKQQGALWRGCFRVPVATVDDAVHGSHLLPFSPRRGRGLTGRQKVGPREGPEGFAHPDGHPARVGAPWCPGKPTCASSEGWCSGREGGPRGRAGKHLKSITPGCCRAGRVYLHVWGEQRMPLRKSREGGLS